MMQGMGLRWRRSKPPAPSAAKRLDHLQENEARTLQLLGDAEPWHPRAPDRGCWPD